MSDDKALLIEALNNYVKPLTIPVAIKVSDSSEIPPKFRRPKDLGQDKMLLCQVMGLVRRLGWNFILTNEEQGCAVSMILLGIKPKPDFQEKGEVVYPLYAATPEAGAISEALITQMPLGHVKSILFAPLDKAPFDPDVVVVYGLPAQITRLIQASVFEAGGVVKSTFGGRAACGNEIVVPYVTGECNVICPGGGERAFGGCGDEELCFALPGAKMGTVARGLEGSHKAGAARVPTPFMNIMSKAVMPAKYKKLEDYCFN